MIDAPSSAVLRLDRSSPFVLLDDATGEGATPARL